jgi:hypothetical protein
MSRVEDLFGTRSNESYKVLMAINFGWSELAPTNAPVEDEPIQPVLRMNILLARCVFFFFTSFLPHLPPQSYLPPTSPLLP